MHYLRDTWYAAGWAHELGEAAVARTILDEPVVLYRGADGSPVALRDACPHRFAPLSRGRVVGDRITCGYHGLTFGRDGRCVHNPHGKGATPSALRVKSYPLTERYGVIWIWMGEPERADPASLPALPVLEDPRFTWVDGRLHVRANYELVVDNLLDLSHVEFLHPFLSSPGNAERTTFRAAQDGDAVSAYYDVSNEPITGLFGLLLDGEEGRADMHSYMHWTAPSNLFLDTGMALSDRPGPLVPTVHLLTPETSDTTHYLWAAGRDHLRESDEVSGMLRGGIKNAFENEDEPMIRAARSRMQSNDLFAHRPALLPIDEANVRARRVLQRLIEAERKRGEHGA